MNGNKQQEELLLEEIRKILLDQDREVQSSVKQDVDLLKTEFLQKENLENRHLEPYFEGKITYLQKNFPKLFGPFLGTAIKMQIRDSQDEIIDALYPIIGKLVRRYLTNEIERLSVQIDERLQETLSPEAWWRRFVAFFSGERYDEGIMKNVRTANLEEIFVIDKESGLLLGHYSFNQLLDADMIAGMLTGIKSFVEQAFMTGPQELEALEYSGYKIVVNNFQRLYLACVINGAMSGAFNTKIQDAVYDFCEKNKIHVPDDISREFMDTTSEQLKQYFQDFNLKN
ncbi:MAG: hypothetical protein ACKVTZ_09520 [Bacteroidia bacterium]